MSEGCDGCLPSLGYVSAPGASRVCCFADSLGERRGSMQ